jgi:hypothetical protein
MFSLQTMFGKGDKFYGLLEASADAARQSTRALIALLNAPVSTRSLDEFRVARRREKELFAQISHALVDTFVTALEREDIEALAAALYKIPKTVEKFAERYVLFSDRLADIDFASRAVMLEKAADVIVQMTSQLRSGFRLDRERSRSPDPRSLSRSFHGRERSGQAAVAQGSVRAARKSDRSLPRCRQRDLSDRAEEFLRAGIPIAIRMNEGDRF